MQTELNSLRLAVSVALHIALSLRFLAAAANDSTDSLGSAVLEIAATLQQLIQHCACPVRQQFPRRRTDPNVAKRQVVLARRRDVICRHVLEQQYTER